MDPISIRLTPTLRKALVKKTKELGCKKISETIRTLLYEALDDQKIKAKNKELQYIATTYYLLSDYIGSMGKQGIKLSNQSHEKAKKAITDLLEH